MKDWRRVIGENIRRRRGEKGLTQEELAGDSGFHLTYLGAIERGKRNPSLRVLVKITKARRTHPADLLRTD